MKLLLELKIENLFKAKDFENKTTGETKASKWKIQAFDKIETEHGSQMKLIDVSIPDSVVSKYKEQIGKIVTIPVGVYVNDKTGKHGFYGLDI